MKIDQVETFDCILDHIFWATAKPAIQKYICPLCDMQIMYVVGHMFAYHSDTLIEATLRYMSDASILVDDERRTSIPKFYI